MKFFKKVLQVVILVTLSDVAVLAAEKQVVVVHKKDVLKELIPIEGMTCVGCEVSLENAVLGIKGVTYIKASAKDNSAVVEFDKTKTDLEAIKKAIQTKGYIAK